MIVHGCDDMLLMFCLSYKDGDYFTTYWGEVDCLTCLQNKLREYERMAFAQRYLLDVANRFYAATLNEKFTVADYDIQEEAKAELEQAYKEFIFAFQSVKDSSEASAESMPPASQP